MLFVKSCEENSNILINIICDLLVRHVSRNEFINIKLKYNKLMFKTKTINKLITKRVVI